MNFKQSIVVERVLSEALSSAEYPFGSSQRQQMLLCIMGEDGTRKRQAIKAIVAGMEAADNIGGNTYHTSLGISIDRSRILQPRGPE